MLASTLARDPHLGRLLTGRIESGCIRANATIKALARDGAVIEQTRVTKLLAFRGLERVGLEEARAGDIVALAGFDRATVADTLCDLEVETRARGPADRPADARDDLLGQRFAARRPGGQQRDGAPDRRAPGARGGGQRRDPGRPGAGRRRLRGRRPRRTAARRADRDHAARGLRALDRPAARAAAHRSADRPDAGADRGGGDRRRRGFLRTGGRQALPAPGGAYRDAADRRRQAAPRVPRPVARADRLSRRVLDRHPRHRRDEPGVPQLCAVQGQHRGPARRRAGLARAGAGGRLCALEPRGARRAVHRSGRESLCRHDHRRAQPAERPRRQPAEEPSS